MHGNNRFFIKILNSILLYCIVMNPVLAGFDPMFAVRISENWLQSQDNQTIEIASDTFDEFIPDNNNNQIGWGVFAGVNYDFKKHWSLQMGLGFDAVNFDDLSGNVWGNADPNFDGIDYQYELEHQRLAAEFKFLREFDDWYPYVTASLGVAWNETENYQETSSTPGELTREHLFNGTTQTDFVYSIGAGIEREIIDDLRIGIGYLFTDAGDSVLTAQNTGQDWKQEVQLQEVLLQLSYIL